MSFSFSITEPEVESTLSTAIDDKIAALPEGPGKEEAQALHDSGAIADAIRALAGDNEFVSASISGSRSPTTSNFSVHIVTRPAPEQM